MPNKPTADGGTGSTRFAASAAARAFADFLRLMRNRAQPALGTATKRRRARGLRREEVAIQAGISVTWYTRLEQARALRVSNETVQAIGRALQLNESQSAHLAQLASAASATSAVPEMTHTATDVVHRLIDAFHPHAAYAVNGLWDVLYANSAACELLGDFNARPPITNNILRRLFLDAAWRSCWECWPEVAASAVAQFRASTGQLVGDEQFKSFLLTLRSESPEFADLWSRHDITHPAGHEKVFLHKDRGRVVLWYNSLTPGSVADDVRVIVYLVVG